MSALSRTEIEILIRARNEAESAFQRQNQLFNQLIGQSGGAAAGMQDYGAKTDRAGASSAAAGVAVGLLADRLGVALVGSFQRAVGAANALDSGLIGLSSVATAFGADAGVARDAAQRLAADGLMTVASAATGLKNLLASGFSLPQAITLMERFKDSAAFGRQGALSLGQAVSSATEGIKNGNSILVDNAGVTKNLSQILTEAGFSATDLSKASSDANVRMALFNGIVKETNPQLGDAARYLQTAAGQQTAFGAQVEIAYQKIGKGLQPALQGALGVLTPFVQVAGEAAPVLIAFGAATAGIVGPLVAARAAAAFGIPSFTGLAASAGSALTVFRGVRTLSDARTGLQLVGESAGITTASLGAFGTAAAIAGAAIAGWEIGSWIADVTELDEAIGDLAVSMGLFGDSRAAAAAAAQEQINRAIRQGADAHISLADAIQYNADKQLLLDRRRQGGTLNDRAAIDARVRLGEITRAEADDLLVLIAAEDRRASASATRQAIDQAAVDLERTLRVELQQHGLSLDELVTRYDANTDAFERWSKSAGVSKDLLAAIKAASKEAADGAKQHEQALKAQATAAAAAAREQQQLDRTLQQFGIVTTRSTVTALDELDRVVQAATQHGVPFEAVVRAIWPELLKLSAQAKDSGIEVAALTAAMKLYEPAVTLVNARTAAWIPLQQAATEANGDLVDGIQAQLQHQRDLASAYETFGLKTPAQLRTVADEAARNYRILAANGTTSVHDLQEAYRQMIDAQKAASGELPTLWQTEVVPGIERALDLLQTSIDGVFAQMLLGAKGFKEGWEDIWDAIKSAATNTLNEILSYYLHQFLAKLTGATQGAGGQMSSGIGQMLGGLMPSGGGLPGTTFGNSALPGFGVMPSTGDSFGGAGGMGGFLSSGLGTALGAGGIVAGGIGAGMLGQRLTGGSGWGAGGIGAGGGALQGAMIGSVVPGIGTAIGAGVGALVGFVGGMIGPSEDRKRTDAANQQLDEYRAKLIETYGSMEKIRDLGEVIGVDLAAGWQHAGEIGLNEFKGAMDEFIARHEQLAGAMERYGVSWEELGPKMRQSTVDEYTTQILDDAEALERAGMSQTDVTKKQASAFSDLYQTILRTGTEASPALLPIFDRLINMGLLVDDAGNKITELGDVKFGGLGDKGGAALGRLLQQIVNVADATGEPSEAFQRLITKIQEGAKAGNLDLGKLHDELSDLVDAGDAPKESLETLNQFLTDIGHDGVTGVGSAADAVSTLNGRLLDTPWQEWQERGEEAGRAVEDAINHASYGRSPGGLKEWTFRAGSLMTTAREDLRIFSRDASESIGAVEAAVRQAVEAMEFKPPTTFERQGAIAPAIQAQINDLEEQIRVAQEMSRTEDPAVAEAKQQLDALRADSPELIALKRRYEDLGVETDEMVRLEREIREARGGEKSRLERQLQALEDAREDERRTIEAEITARERAQQDQQAAIQAQIEALQVSADLHQQEIQTRMALLQAQRDELAASKNPLEGFAVTPERISEEQALARVNEVFQAYAGQNASAEDIRLLQSLYGNGPLYRQRLDALLQQVVMQVLQQQLQGFDTGTKGVTGQFFADFRRGTPIIAHGHEAILTPSDIPEFLRQYGGDRADGQPVSVNLYVAVDQNGQAKVVDRDQWVLATVQRGLTTGQIRVPTRVLAGRMA